MPGRLLVRLLLFAATYLLVCEIVIRAGGQYNEDGQFSFLGLDIPPYQLPVTTLQQVVDRYMAQRDSVLLAYDPLTGWRFNPGFATANHSIRVNGAGIRADREYTLEADKDVLRIGLFGNSMIMGGEVLNHETIAHYLEEALAARGIPNEVLNFGVSAYGLDQTYLRWQNIGREYNLDIVLLGLTSNDAGLVTNIFRPIIAPNTQIAFSKPRFILDGDGLRLINSPAVPPEDLSSIFRDFPTYPLARYEGGYQSRYTNEWWLGSRYLALMMKVVEPDLTETRPEGQEIVIRIISQFEHEVTDAGSMFLMLYLPSRVDVERIQSGAEASHDATLARVNIPVLRFDDIYRRWTASDWMPIGHYRPESNRAIAEALAEALD